MMNHATLECMPNRSKQTRCFAFCDCFAMIFAAAFIGAALLAPGAYAQTPAATSGPGGYPQTGRVMIVVPFSPGGATDIIARLLADELGKRWGSTVTVDNKAGAGGGIGTEFVARAKGDGFTLLLGTQTALAVNPSLMKKLPYDVGDRKSVV